MRSTTTSVLCTLTVLVMLVSSTASAAPVCNATNFICTNTNMNSLTPADDGGCNCCAGTDLSNCEAAQTRCTVSFYSCGAGKPIGVVGDSCQCCPGTDECDDTPQSLCPPSGYGLCTACEDGKCTSCVADLAVSPEDGLCAPTCVVPDCRSCQKDDPRRCSVCKDKFVLSELYTCVDGVFGLQSSYVAAAAAMLAMLVALVV